MEEATLSFRCEGTGKLLKVSGMTPEAARSYRFFASKDAEADHRKLEEDHGRLVHNKCVRVDHSDNMRAVDRDDPAFGEFVQNIAKVGLLEPLLVERDTSVPPYAYVLRAGFRRWEALATLGEELIPIRLLPDHVSPRVAQLAENVFRKDASPMEIASALAEVREEQEKESGQPVSERWLQNQFGFSSVSRVHDYLDLAKATPELKKALDEGVLPLAKAALLASLPEDRQGPEIEKARETELGDLRRYVSRLKADMGIAQPKSAGKPARSGPRAVSFGTHKLAFRPLDSVVLDLRAVTMPSSDELARINALEETDAAIVDAIVRRERFRTLEYVTGVISALDADIVELDFTEPASEEKPVKARVKARVKAGGSKPAKKRSATKKATMGDVPLITGDGRVRGVVDTEEPPTEKKPSSKKPSSKKPPTKKTPAKKPSKTLSLKK